jgi:hypothetical protein
MLAIILVVLTTLVAMRGSISDRGATYAASAASTVHAAVASPWTRRPEVSRRERLRRRRNGAAANGAGPSHTGAKSAAAPPPAVIDAAPAPSKDAAGAGKPPLEVEVPIDLSTELLLAVAASRRTDGGGPPPSGRESVGAMDIPPRGAVDELKLELRRALLDRLDLDALERLADRQLLSSRIREAAADVIRATNAPLSPSERLPGRRRSIRTTFPCSGSRSATARPVVVR